MKINVTQRHIDEGVQRNAAQCAIALAAQEASGSKDCGVGVFSLWIGGNFYILPTQARKFMRAFDAGCKGLPFEFEIYNDITTN